MMTFKICAMTSFIPIFDVIWHFFVIPIVHNDLSVKTNLESYTQYAPTIIKSWSGSFVAIKYLQNVQDNWIKQVDVAHFSSFNIISYFIILIWFVVCLIRDSLILDQLWSTLVHTMLKFLFLFLRNRTADKRVINIKHINSSYREVTRTIGM